MRKDYSLKEISEKILKHLPSIGGQGVYPLVKRNKVIVEDYNLCIEKQKRKKGMCNFIVSYYFNENKIYSQHIKTLSGENIEDVVRFFLICVAEMKIAKSMDLLDE